MLYTMFATFTKIFFVSSTLFAVAKSSNTRKLGFFLGRSQEGLVPRPPPEVIEAAKANTNIKTEWFQQKVDNFGPYVQTWWQQYQLNAQYYKPGGPMFVMIGGEAPISIGWMNWGDWVKNAKTYGAYLFQVEHRYYGESHPTLDASTVNLKWLTSEQALADLANFIPAMKLKYSLPNATKVIVFGGSYPGSLAAWFRLRYPEIAQGAIASSAPVWAKADFYEYLEVVGKSLDYVSPGCTNLVHDAFAMLNQETQSGNVAPLTELFNLCEPLDITKLMDIASFYETAIATFQSAVQYNRMGPNSWVKEMCVAMANETLGNPVERLAYLNRDPQYCIDYIYDDTVTFLKSSSWNSTSVKISMRQWFYQTCTEFGYYQTTDSANQPFGSHLNLPFAEKLCTDVFGIAPATLNAGIQNTNSIYGSTNLKATNVVLPNGSIDPWHVLGILASSGSTEIAEYYIGGSHCYDMLEPGEFDSEALQQVRKDITKYIGQFLEAKM